MSGVPSFVALAATTEPIVPPLVILVIGIVTVIGMIIWMKLNAFIALITAAIVVSLLAPGDVSEKISRVAEQFGNYAGNIGIVIALAAVIGMCMMESGAADKVVRTFLRLLGEKRASFALMGSGFVLAVPVFFDTVFYLLVPLARSLYKRTNRNYLMYILAITAGGAITHTLVPPTPGPLIMAATLNIDLGVMILVGACVALPAAVSGILFAKIADRVSNVPMRPLGTEREAQPLEDDQLPSLFWSILPVVLPVLMISANTVLDTLANQERAARLEAGDVRDWQQLRSAVTDESSKIGAAIRAELPAGVVEGLHGDDSLSDDERAEAIDAFNQLLLAKDFYDEDTFYGTLDSPGKIGQRQQAGDISAAERAMLGRMQAAHSLIDRGTGGLKKHEVERLNRLLVEIALPDAVRPHTWETPRRRAADVSALFGNANFALLLSTAIALFVFYKQRNPSLAEFAASVETSLMSGGAIILITAAGGAFGAMLKQAQIGSAIQELFGDVEATGLFYLFLGFGIAALLKIAQGSSTTAMIVTSGMLASTVAGEPLPFHAVYLATAIGAGSLIGSWMNDSGFWIFTKMGGLTEVESLKSWTPLLIVLGLVSMTVTVVLALVMPLA